MKPPARYVFRGDPKLHPADAHQDSPDKPEPYVAEPELIQAVNLAIYLRRPLLLEGEAGCGKTRLAAAIAYELGLPYYRWDVRSTTKAREGLYEYDAILRLHDVQAQKVDAKLNRDPSDPKNYRKFGAMGKAFQMRDRSAVVLIDEIDKADIDFPNDLLGVLDEPWKFEIPETGETPVQADQKHLPIVIVTSNREKGNLPVPFLRRCVYYFVQFPEKDRLKQIVEAHYQTNTDLSAPKPNLVDAATDRFLTIRKSEGWSKKPGTSEFLDWLSALQHFNTKPFSAEQLKQVKPLPYRELLFKRRDDWARSAAAT
jgi:MoxR-like ATPase